jgi:hypothetical protein
VVHTPGDATEGRAVAEGGRGGRATATPRHHASGRLVVVPGAEVPTQASTIARTQRLHGESAGTFGGGGVTEFTVNERLSVLMSIVFAGALLVTGPQLFAVPNMMGPALKLGCLVVSVVPCVRSVMRLKSLAVRPVFDAV